MLVPCTGLSGAQPVCCLQVLVSASFLSVLSACRFASVRAHSLFCWGSTRSGPPFNRRSPGSQESFHLFDRLPSANGSFKADGFAAAGLQRWSAQHPHCSGHAPSVPQHLVSQAFVGWVFCHVSGFALGRCTSFKPFWPPALVQLVPAAIVFKAPCQPGGAVLFRGLHPVSQQVFLFCLLGFTVRSPRPALIHAQLHFSTGRWPLNKIRITANVALTGILVAAGFCLLTINSCPFRSMLFTGLPWYLPSASLLLMAWFSASIAWRWVRGRLTKPLPGFCPLTPLCVHPVCQGGLLVRHWCLFVPALRCLVTAIALAAGVPGTARSSWLLLYGRSMAAVKSGCSTCLLP